ncbi:helix-turn-helix domain-containing protein [Puteibacter caeruleilacunae]|nr:helix-turn-helix domain-containing protein [Puteibacter caeruleilacunae]
MEFHALQHSEFDLSVKEIKYENQYDFRKIHRHAYYEVFLFEHGNGGEQLIDFDTYQTKDKTLYIVAPYQVHLSNRQHNENGILLQFSPQYLRTSLSEISTKVLFSLKENPVLYLSEQDYDTLYRSFVRMRALSKTRERFKKEKLKHLFAFALLNILDIIQSEEHSFKKNKLTYQFLELAETEFIEQRNISEYAQQLNVSATKLTNQIKQDLGKTPLKIIHDLITVEIKRLITMEHLSHKEISHMLHFDSQSTYSRFVKKHIGCNPSELSKKLEIHK